MRRLHLMEIHEQSWFPQSLRNFVTDTLQFTWNLADVYGPIVPRLRDALRRAGARRIIDLCSGGGGPWLRLHGSLVEHGSPPIKVCLTDKYPNAQAFDFAESVSKHTIRFHPRPVDAMRVPRNLSGFRTLFTSFHHFGFRTAREILQDAVEKGEGIGIFEISGRYFSAFLGVFLMGLAHFAFAPFVRPFHRSRLFWTYVIPVVPLVLVLDGISSCMRTWSPVELRELIESCDENDYRWEIGKEKGALPGLRITYLIGCPNHKKRRRTCPVRIACTEDPAGAAAAARA